MNNNDALERVIQTFRHRRIRWRIIAVLGVVVLLMTAYALKYKIDALSRIPTCGLEEHTHDETCYNTDGSLICGMVEHVHTDACYQERPKSAAVEADVEEEGEIDLPFDESDGTVSGDVDDALDEDNALVGELYPLSPVYDLNGDSYVLLSDVLAEAYPEYGVRDVEAAGESILSEDQVLSVSVEFRDGDYVVSALRDFIGDKDMVELCFFTRDGGAYLVNLMNGTPEKQDDAEPAPKVEAAKEPVTQEDETAKEPVAQEAEAEDIPTEAQGEAEAETTTDVEGETEGQVEAAGIDESEAGEKTEEKTEGNNDVEADTQEEADTDTETVTGTEADTEAETDTETEETASGEESAETRQEDEEAAVTEHEAVTEGKTEAEEAVETEGAADSEKETEVENDFETEEDTDSKKETEVENDTKAEDDADAEDNTEAEDNTDDADAEDQAADDSAEGEGDETANAGAPAILRYTADIDVADYIAPFSLNALMAEAHPDEAQTVREAEPETQTEASVDSQEETDTEADDDVLIEEAPVEETEVVLGEPSAEEASAPTITFDETLFSMEASDGDTLVTPLASFEAATITVEAGDIWVLNLYNYTMPEPTPVYPAQTFEAHVDGIAVYVSADEGAFPEGTTMEVAPVYDESTLDDIASSVEEEGTRVRNVLAVDITFRDAEGNEIEPLIPISVAMNVEEIKQVQDTVIVHMDDAGNAEVVEPTESDAEAIAFDAESFSVYALVVTEHYISADGQRFSIQLTYGADAGIPEDATLRVEEVDDPIYTERTSEAIGDDCGIRFARYFDITILSNGQEIQPAAPVEVCVTLDDAVEADHVQAVHFDEDAIDVIETDAQDNAVTFEAEGFSVYGIVYTVDFAYEINGKIYTFSMTGGEKLPLAALVEALNLLEDAGEGAFADAEDFVSHVTDVDFSDPSLVSVVHEDGTWRLDSLAPFQSEERLVVTMDDEEKFTVVVTDAQIRRYFLSSSGETYEIEVIYDSLTGIPEDADLAVTEILEDGSAYDRSYGEYVAGAESALGWTEGWSEYFRVFDIKIVDAQDPTIVYQPAEGTIVHVSIRLADADSASLDVVHFADGEETGDVLQAETDGNAVRFDTDGFSIYAVAGYTLEKTIEAGDGSTYRVVLTFREDAMLPDGAQLEVEELAGEDYQDYVGRTAAAMHAGDFDYARVFDISIVDGEGEKVQPFAPVDVSIELMDADDAPGDFTVMHFEGESEEVQQVAVETEDDTVSFVAESFSAYAIVSGPSTIPIEWQRLTSLSDLDTYGSIGVYIGHKSGYYFTDGITESVKDGVKRFGITKTTPAASCPSFATCTRYYFEPVEGSQNQYYFFCMDGDTRKYVYNGGNNSLSFTTDEQNRTAFTVMVDSEGQFQLHNGAWFVNMQGGGSGSRFCAYNGGDTDPNNLMYIWFYAERESDMYGLNGQTYGLISWSGGVTGKAVMASAGAAGSLAAEHLTVMSKQGDHNDQLFLPNDINDVISLWTFEWFAEDRYYLRSGDEYLSMSKTGGLSMVASKDDATLIQVIPGTGVHEGEICLKANGAVLSYSGKMENGFRASGSAGSEWLNLAIVSNLTDDYFMTYSARKVSVSGSEVSDGAKIIIYTRYWNDTNKRYDYYALDADGSLVPCFESGDSIEWVGHRINTLLWQFTEYTFPDGTPNDYYELTNLSSGKRVAPQSSSNQVLSNDTIGILLNGRHDGAYYTPILAWDKPDYAYAGLKVEDGQIVACPSDEAMDFYFAIMEDIPVDDTLHEVATVDNEQHGITMKMVDIKTREEMSNYLGNDEGGITVELQQGLLSTDLKDNGYPTAKGGSLSHLYRGAQDVNHLFIESTYRASGYYEFDSTQNFASLHGKNFKVYKELGSYDSVGSRPTLKHGQFFPYNDLEAGVFAAVNDQNLFTPATNGELPESDPRKYEQLYLVKKVDCYFGMELSADFIQTPDGLDDWGHDIIFEFSGDDDFWLYVDGELVIDLGGIHSAVPGSVNFRTGQVNVNGTQTTLYDLFYNNYLHRDNHTPEQAQAYVNELFRQNSAGQWIFKDGTTHKLRIFYMERGAGASNLHIRFNLSSEKPGTVLLSKELEGVDDSESKSVKFPYQIKYWKDGVEKNLTNALPDSTQPEDHMFYKDTTRPVEYVKSLTIDGITYEDVFLLKPGETAEINFDDASTEYRIIECGVNTEVYEEVRVNGAVNEGTAAGSSGNRRDYGISTDQVCLRAKVDYVNVVKNTQPLTIEKKLFNADEQPILLYNADGTPKDPNDPDLERTFEFRISFGAEFDEDAQTAAYFYTYHVKDPAGVYCTWNKSAQKFERIEHDGVGVTDYEDLLPAEKLAASFKTGVRGSIANIPAYYRVEVRDLLPGTKFNVVERPSDTPDGYEFWRYEYNDSYYEDVDSGVSGTITADAPAHVDVCNYKGYGLRLRKTWSDEQFIEKRDPAYFAVFVAGEGQTLDLVDGTVRRLKYDDDQTLYWYFLRLPFAGTQFDQYVVCEVTLKGDITVDGSGKVTGYSEVSPVRDGSGVELHVLRKNEEAWKVIDYEVSYAVPEWDGDNVRVFRVHNESTARPRIILRKQDWDGNPLAGATFVLEDSNHKTLGPFTSDSDGLICIAYLQANMEYILRETASPKGFTGLKHPLKILITVPEGAPQEESVSVTPWYGDDDKGDEPKDDALENSEDALYYELTTEDGTGIPVLSLKNRPWTLQVIKVDAATSHAMQGVKFDLYKYMTVNGVTNYVKCYEGLTTDANGVIPGVDQRLAPCDYKLVEAETPSGYFALSGDVYFTISQTGDVSFTPNLDVPEGVTLNREESGASDGARSIRYTLTIPNTPYQKVMIYKVGPDEKKLTGASFALYRADEYDPETGELKDESFKAVIEGTVDNNGILKLGTLACGEYYLVETEAPAGYILPDHPIHIRVSTDEVTYMQDTERNAESVTVDGETIWKVTVWNATGVSLPSTGGSGLAMIHTFGLALTLLAIVGLILMNRKRGKGEDA